MLKLVNFATVPPCFSSRLCYRDVRYALHSHNESRISSCLAVISGDLYNSLDLAGFVPHSIFIQ
jgi:hypothetical protein